MNPKAQNNGESTEHRGFSLGSGGEKINRFVIELERELELVEGKKVPWTAKTASDAGLWREFATGASLHHKGSKAFSCLPRTATIKT